MRIKNRIMNVSEVIVDKELRSIADENDLRVYAKMRLSDVIDDDDYYLERELFSYYTRSHFDFTVTSPEQKPVMAIEFDGPYHNDPEQIARDAKKDRLCKQAGLPILRINANHVLRKYRGMTLLRWIIEVIKAQEWFYKAQEEGQISSDEPWDPSFIIASEGNPRKYPYWLSAVAHRQIDQFLDGNDHEKMGWYQLFSTEHNHRHHALEYLRVGDHILYVHTSVRNQDVDFNWWDLLREVTHCEMGEQLASFLRGEQQLIPIKDFQLKHDELCERYNINPRFRSGRGFDLAE
jgi:hypothetical protein